MDEKPKKKRQRSVSYPGYSLKDSLDFLRKIKAALGTGPYYRDHMSKAIGYKGYSGVCARKIGSMTHFGLLKSGKKSTYDLTDLGKVLSCDFEDEKYRECLVKAAKSPSLFNNLIGIYDNSALPTHLHHILHRDFRILEKMAKDCALNFTTSMEYSGLLKNGILHSEPMPEKENNSKELGSIEESDTTTEKSALVEPVIQNKGEASCRAQETELKEEKGMEVIPIGLQLGRTARLEIPKPVTKSDFQRIVRWLNFMEGEYFEKDQPEISGN